MKPLTGSPGISVTKEIFNDVYFKCETGEELTVSMCNGAFEIAVSIDGSQRQWYVASSAGIMKRLHQNSTCSSGGLSYGIIYESI